MKKDDFSTVTGQPDPEFPEEEPFKPPTDKLALSAVILAAAVLLFGIVMLMISILGTDWHTPGESAGWGRIVSILAIMLFAFPSILNGAIALPLACSAFFRYREIWIRDAKCRTRIWLSFLFDALGMLMPILALILHRMI